MWETSQAEPGNTGMEPLKKVRVRTGLYHESQELIVVKDTVKAKEKCGIGYGVGIMTQDLAHDMIDLDVEMAEKYGCETESELKIEDVD